MSPSPAAADNQTGMNAFHAASMAFVATAAYYIGFLTTLFLGDLGRGFAGIAGAHPGPRFDAAYQSWWTERRSAIVAGVVCAVIAAAIRHGRSARRDPELTWGAGAVLATVIVAVQPGLQFMLVQRSAVHRFSAGDADAAASLPNLGVQQALPAVIDRLHAGGADAPQLAESAMRFSGGSGEVRRVALDRLAPPAARFSAALALARSADGGPEVDEVLAEAIRDADPAFRISVPRRLKAAWFIDTDRVGKIRRQLLADANVRVRRAALADHESMAACDVMPTLVNDPDHEVRLKAFQNLRYCHSVAPKVESVRSERIAIYRTLLKHSELAIRIGSARALADLGDVSGNKTALEFVRGDPYGKDPEILVMAIRTVQRNLGEASAPMLWTIFKCDRAVYPRGHYYQARNAADSALDELYGYDKWPPQYRRDSSAPAPMLAEFCVTD